MIINHKYKFIFIKSFKTAGTSLEIALAKFCSENDIITTIVEEDEKIRKKIGYSGPRNNKGFSEHMSALEIKKKLNKDIFNNYFKFVTIRNPFEQIKSAFYWHNESKKKEKKFFIFKKKPKEFDEFFKIKGYHIFEDEFNRYTESEKILVDFFIRYENLEDDLNKITNILKLPESLYNVFKTISAKTNISPPKQNRISLNENQTNKIYKLAQKIILLHKYKS